VSARPNVLWVCTDQQRADTLGCYGNPWVRTPNLDRLAQRGVRFEHAYAQSPVCTPSRASFLTGRYPRTTRCRQNGQSIPGDEVLVTRLLADAGYSAGLSGKLHVSACHPSVAPVSEPRIEDGYASFRWSHHPAPDWPGNAYVSWLRSLGDEFSTPPYPGSDHVRSGMPAERHQTTWCVEQAIEFIQAHEGHAMPWLSCVNLFDPHHPFDPPPGHLERYLDRLEALPLPNFVPGELGDKPVFQQVDHHGAYGGNAGLPFDRMDAEDHRLVRAAYWAMCDLIDEGVGRLLEALDATGQAEDTLVVFMSDHGELLGDHGMYLKGPHFYEPAVRVPLIAAWPGRIPAGRTSRALVELVDLAPTLLDAARLPGHAGMQGRSLWPLLTGEAPLDEHRDDVYCEYYDAMRWHEAPPAEATMVRTARWKLVRAHSLGTGELYDLERDPMETVNRWADPEAAPAKLELLARLSDRMARTVDPLPPRRAPW